MINTREIAEEYRLRHWAGRMQERVERGLSIKDYCQEEGICGNTYFYWQRRVRAATCEALMAQKPEPKKDHVPTGWTAVSSESDEGQAIAVKVTPVPSVTSSLVVEVGGCRIAVDTRTDMELLVSAVRALKSV